MRGATLLWACVGLVAAALLLAPGAEGLYIRTEEADIYLGPGGTVASEFRTPGAAHQYGRYESTAQVCSPFSSPPPPVPSPPPSRTTPTLPSVWPLLWIAVMALFFCCSLLVSLAHLSQRTRAHARTELSEHTLCTHIH